MILNTSVSWSQNRHWPSTDVIRIGTLSRAWSTSRTTKGHLEMEGLPRFFSLWVFSLPAALSHHLLLPFSLHGSCPASCLFRAAREGVKWTLWRRKRGNKWNVFPRRIFNLSYLLDYLPSDLSPSHEPKHTYIRANLSLDFFLTVDIFWILYI